jgi:hypothetical protein
VAIIQHLKKGSDIVAVNLRERFTHPPKKGREFGEVTTITEYAV